MESDPGMTILRVTVRAEDEGGRLDQVLSRALDDLSRTRIKGLIENGRVVLDGRTVTEASQRVKSGMSCEISLPPAADPRPVAQSIPLDIVYEDDDLIVVNKPAGMVVHPAPGNRDQTLVNALLAHCGDSLSGVGGVRRPGIVHRLDKDTSGLLVAAKNDTAHAGLSALFQEHDIERAYLALVWGVPSPRRGRIEGLIGRDPRNRKKMAVVSRNGKHAVTDYTVEKVLASGKSALVRCVLATGRTHQIRVHLASIGHPVMGDRTYGRARRGRRGELSEAATAALAGLNRQALHAAELGFRHPVTGERLNFARKPPNDMEMLLSVLSEVVQR
jgi:23S rRNA pseudouridine1911/1915/1917 synthase